MGGGAETSAGARKRKSRGSMAEAGIRKTAPSETKKTEYTMEAWGAWIAALSDDEPDESPPVILPPKNPWSYLDQTRKHCKLALDHYNKTTTGAKFELVEALGSQPIIYNGLWMHVGFIARPIGVATRSSRLTPKHFFGEIGFHTAGNTIYCCIVDPDSRDTSNGCGSCCPELGVYHPKKGFEAGKWPYRPEGVIDDVA